MKQRFSWLAVLSVLIFGFGLGRATAAASPVRVHLIPPVTYNRDDPAQQPANRSLMRLTWPAALTPDSAPVTEPTQPSLRAQAHLRVGSAAPTARPEDSGKGPTAAQWAKLRACESGGNYSANTGNGYYGAYQADLTTWHSNGFTDRPDLAAPSVQDQFAALLYARRGAQPWPACGKWLKLNIVKGAP